MTSEILLKNRTVITAQQNYQTGPVAWKAGEVPTDATWNTSGAYYGALPTVINNTIATVNGKGAHFLKLILAVTTGATSDTAPGATAQIWYSESYDDSAYTKYRYSHTVGEVITSADGVYYDAGIFELSAPYTKLVVAAVTYDIDDGDLLAIPMLYEGQ